MGKEKTRLIYSDGFGNIVTLHHTTTNSPECKYDDDGIMLINSFVSIFICV